MSARSVREDDEIAPGSGTTREERRGDSSRVLRRDGLTLGRQLADCLTACLDRSPHGWLIHVWSAVRQRTISQRRRQVP